MKKVSLLVLLLLGLITSVFGQVTDNVALESQIKKGIDKAYAASVRIWGFDTIRKVQNSSQFSGVVVSADGHILTVAHAIQTNMTYKVLFPDGKEVMAVAHGRMGFPDMQNRPDIGMIKIIDKGTWPAAELGWSHSLKVDEPCISISYPETLNQRLPSVRFGRIINVLDEWGFVRSTCKMEPGDSGGPLFDYMGRVVAMHSRCDQSEGINYEVPIDTYRKYWDALQVAEDYKKLPVATNEVKTDPLTAEILSIPINPGVGLLGLTPNLRGTCVKIKSKANGIEKTALGTVFITGSKFVIVSKSSLVGSNPIVYIDGKAIDAIIAARDNENDLVLLQVVVKIKSGISLNSIKVDKDAKLPDLGHFLVSPLPDGSQQQSVIGSTYFNLPRKFSVGYFGAGANFRDEKIILSRISPNSPAAQAKLQTGDQIIGINGVLISKAEHYGAELTKYNPGDTVAIQGIRDGTNYNLNVVLIRRPPGSHPADNFEGGKSIRLDGFKNVFSHDPILRAENCGGPVFDTRGQFYGINIARFSRTTTLIMPAGEIKHFIESSLKK